MTADVLLEYLHRCLGPRGRRRADIAALVEHIPTIEEADARALGAECESGMAPEGAFATLRQELDAEDAQ